MGNTQKNTPQSEYDALWSVFRLCGQQVSPGKLQH